VKHLCFYVVDGGKRRKIRQCTWLFDGAGDSERLWSPCTYANKLLLDDRKELFGTV
jgi:hypothetical protein